jgi:hypothetical protein
MSFLWTTSSANETERQSDLFTGLSACFSFLYLLGENDQPLHGSKNISPQIMKGLTSINLIVFGGPFLVMLIFAFLPPIILTGLVLSG